MQATLYGDRWQPPPEPKDAEFVRRVRTLVQEADDGARDLAGMRRRVLPGTEAALMVGMGRFAPRPGGRKPTPRRGRHSGDGSCVGCGCPRDEETKGCRNCHYRHLMRLHSRLRRICRMIERAFP